jgi:myo-inositol-1(or 4)-monophosphatase
VPSANESRDLAELLALAQSVAASAGRALLAGAHRDQRAYVHAADLPREIKAVADTVMEEHILAALAPTGLAILSEEAGLMPGRGSASPRWFIVDPLDGTFNFVKGLGPCAVSIALWDAHQPVFGVIYSLADAQLAWGGPGLGAHSHGEPIAVSATVTAANASICTGFPVRFDFDSDAAMVEFRELVRPFAKVRMLGSAAISLLHVARGSADVYAERDIMLWDVAAGLAIVQGAGGSIRFDPGPVEYSLNVRATNGRIS